MTTRHHVEFAAQRYGMADIAPSSPPLGSAQARHILGRRLEQLVGGVYLSEIGISRLTHRLTNQQYKAGEMIVKQGVKGDFMGLVSSGQVAVFSPFDAGSAQTLDSGDPTYILVRGGIFGEAMLADGIPSESTLRAVTDVEVQILRRSGYLDVAAQPFSRPASHVRLVRSRPFVVGLIALLAVIVGSLILGAALLATGNRLGHRGTGPFSFGRESNVVQILAPQNQQVLLSSRSIPVRAILSEPGFSWAELHVDGARQAMLANPEPGEVPWIMEWGWERASEGVHSLAIQAHYAQDEWVTSVPVTVTVVPSGTLAFASNRAGAYSVYAMSSDGRNVIRLTSGPGDTRQPAWGMGPRLAFVTESEVGPAVIRQMMVDGPDKEDLAVGRDASWSSDGTQLAYAATVEGVSQVLAMSKDGGVPSQVTAELVYAGQPSWSPDGREVAFVAERDGNWDIWVATLDTGAQHRLTGNPSMDWAPAWSPDGSQLAFVSDRGGSHQIHVMRTDGSGIRSLTEFPRGAELPAWSSDGFWLAFVAYTGEADGVNAREIHLMRADGRDQVRLTHNAFDDTQPNWRRAP